ncbi:MAG TPA: ABC transporter substrate-binding protein [Stellaceae bacterium]|nr:ABC transporter substrate-binding protein [Stellaceae bacterium]
MRERQDRIGRRAFVAGLGAASMPGIVGAQQRATPVIGFLNSYSPEEWANRLAAFQQGLSDAGYVEGRNVAIEYRWARGRLDDTRSLAAELVRRRVDVIVTSGGEIPAMEAKAATSSIPIVAMIARDPVQTGLVASINAPGGNVTGVSAFFVLLEPKRLELIHELIPAAAIVAEFRDPAYAAALAVNPSPTDVAEVAAQRLGIRMRLVNVGNVGDLDAAFKTLGDERIGALSVSTQPLFDTIPVRKRLVELAAQYAIPTGYFSREPVVAGGLMSYGVSSTGLYRALGVYAGRVLNGDKPADLPVLQPSKFELVINLKTAKALGIAVPPLLLARADEVIE